MTLFLQQLAGVALTSIAVGLTTAVALGLPLYLINLGIKRSDEVATSPYRSGPTPPPPPPPSPVFSKEHERHLKQQQKDIQELLARVRKLERTKP